MALIPATRIGLYEVATQIGVGGMGDVYRATDTTLGRQVAIKVLPEPFAQDADRLARFEREAKTLASLNHPHIAQILSSAQVLAFWRQVVVVDRKIALRHRGVRPRPWYDHDVDIGR